MHRLGVIIVVIGGLATGIGLIVGFALMFGGHDDGAKLFLALVPAGFLAGFTGLVMTLLHSPGPTRPPD